MKNLFTLGLILFTVALFAQDKVITKNGRNNFSIIMVLEGGGRYCLNN